MMTKGCWHIAPVSSQSITELRAVPLINYSNRLSPRRLAFTTMRCVAMSVAWRCISCIVRMVVEMEATLYHCASPIKGKNVSWNIDTKKRCAYTEQQLLCECMCEYECDCV